METHSWNGHLRSEHRKSAIVEPFTDASSLPSSRLLKHSTKADLVADYLRNEIVNGRIRPGDKIVADEIAKKLGVSRTPVREALKILEAGGYLSTKAHFGVRVTTFSPKDFVDLSRVRQVLDGLAAQLAAERLSDAERSQVCAKLTQLNDDLVVALRASDANLAARLNADFHRELYRGANSELLFDMVNLSNLSWDLYPLADRYFWEMASRTERIPAEVHQQHGAIIKAILEGNPDEAWNAARQHIQASGYLMDEAEQEH